MARPMPVLPPVTSATLPEKLNNCWFEPYLGSPCFRIAAGSFDVFVIFSEGEPIRARSEKSEGRAMGPWSHKELTGGRGGNGGPKSNLRCSLFPPLARRSSCEGGC